jgi:DNA-binding NtrC family response regulator
MADLEKVLAEKVKPKLDEAMARFLGVTIREINADITDRLKKSPLFDFDINTRLKYKEAKSEFRKAYLSRLLHFNFGNVSEVARIAGIDRRSVHRLVKTLDLDPDKARRDMLSSQYLRSQAVQGIIETTLENYREVLNPSKLEKMYSNVENLSREIIRDLPDEPLTLHEAESEFDKKFFTRVLMEEHSITKAARRIGLRYESLHRKLKSLGVRS